MKGTSHTRYDLKYHIILTTKYRKPLLDRSLPYADKVIELIKGMEKDGKFGFSVIEINCDTDHIHMLVEAGPRMAPSVVIRHIKQITTHTLWGLYERDLKKEFWKTRLFWSPSSFVTTVGVVDEDVVAHYIANQGRNIKVNKTNSSPKLKQRGLLGSD